MPISPLYSSPEVLRQSKKLQLLNDFYDGVDTATDHLIRYDKESEDAFKSRKELSRLSNYIKKSVDCVRDLIMRKQPDFNELEGTVVEPFIDKIDLTQNLSEFIRDTIVCLKRDSKAYILVEKQFSEENTNGSDLKPYFVLIPRSAVTSIRYDEDGKLEQFIYKETIQIKELYGYTEEERVRVYTKEQVEVWKTGSAVPESIFANELSEIPVVEMIESEIPTLYDLAKINKNHFNQQSERRSYQRIAAAPIPVINGKLDEGITVVGVSDGIHFKDPDGSFTWTELTGVNDEILEKAILHDEKDMRSYIAELLRSDVERTATEINIENVGNEATISHIAQLVESGINKAFIYMAEYQGVNNFDAKIYLNKDFATNKLTADETRVLIEQYTQNLISFERFAKAMIDGEVWEEMTQDEIEAEKERLAFTPNVELSDEL